MRKFTADEVRAFDPSLSAAEVAETVALLNEPPVSMRERWAAEEDDLARAMLDPPKIGRDGLTEAQRRVNAFADDLGLPIPFPPK